MPESKFLASRLSSMIVIRELITIVGKEFAIPAKAIVSSRRKTRIVEARQIICFIIYEETDIPTLHTAYALNYADHTAVLHGVRRVEEKLKQAMPPDLSNKIGRCVVEFNTLFSQTTSPGVD